MKNKSLKIGVLGLGLIGGSILKKLKLLDKYFLVAVSKSSHASALSYADVSTEDISALKVCDIVFVCSRMSEITEKLDILNKIFDKNTVVADVCSLKGFLNKEYNFNFIPSHPMAGTEFKGFENSFPSLFEGAKWIVAKENKLLFEIIGELGAKPVLMEQNLHDKLAAQISHLPSILALALFSAADDEAKKIASTGFCDMTRLAMQDSELLYDMLNLNRKNVEDAFLLLIEKYNKIKNLNETEFKIFASEIAQKRAKMYNEARKNLL